MNFLESSYYLNARTIPVLRDLAVVLAMGLLTACSGGSANDHSSPRSSAAPISTVPDATDSEIIPVTQNIYQRPYDYPYMVNLPPQFVTIASGKTLSVRVSLPANERNLPANGPFPVILTHTGYNSSMMSLMFMGMPGNLMLGTPDYFMVRHGYAQVSVDALGTGASEGGWELFGEAEQTAYGEMVDWVHQQAWSNGKLGVAGVSYGAISSLFTAQQRPDTVDAIFASLPMGDAMRGIAGTGGLINAHFLSNWMTITETASTLNVLPALAYPQHMSQYMRSTQEHVEQIDSFYLPLIEDVLRNEPYINYDGDFWRTRSPLENIDKIKAPTFIFGALDDLFQRDEPLLYEQLKHNGVDTRLVVYNGFHFHNFVTSHIGNAQVPPIDYLMLQWFDRYLKGLETGTDGIPEIVQHVKNYPTKSTPAEFQNDSYITTTDWPHPAATAERWYLHGDLGLTRDMPVENETSHSMVNPDHPVVRASRSENLLKFEIDISDGTSCSRSFEQWILGLEMPETCFYSTNNSPQQRLLFESEPMEEDYFINGPIQADIWIDSTVTEAVVAVQIEEVSSKNAAPLTNGQLLASARAVDLEKSRFMDGEMIQPFHYLTQEKASPLVPGEIVKMSIEIFPTSAIIRKGNRLRVSVSPSNQAQGILNYPRQALAADGVTTIHISPDHPSSVVLPIVPARFLN